ncbi:SixA phosphatase family protein [Sphingobium algorifonticola]|uniref:Histidine phosphatase family protein n=1 Tax=Sphingobium algorifonticola TaxID=2008318 RepID=A0A437JAY6_9SPHN|nr:histidine phosphatase family protein [Sphingobium algorifonticola]RVT43067.1 histidine phosphatase family protein [Sphingobium algorifonticola]
MKRLTLLRHAKSGWDDPVKRDFDRPLNGRGEKAATLMGQYALDSGMAFDLLVASPAVRVVETLDHFLDSYGKPIETVWDRRIYLASAAALFDVLHAVPESADNLLMAGHNPGLEDLILELVPESDGDALRAEVETKFPTASLATIALDVAHWKDVASGCGRLVAFTRPRDLDAALGPEAY